MYIENFKNKFAIVGIDRVSINELVKNTKISYIVEIATPFELYRKYMMGGEDIPYLEAAVRTVFQSPIDQSIITQIDLRKYVEKKFIFSPDEILEYDLRVNKIIQSNINKTYPYIKKSIYSPIIPHPLNSPSSEFEIKFSDQLGIAIFAFTARYVYYVQEINPTELKSKLLEKTAAFPLRYKPSAYGGIFGEIVGHNELDSGLVVVHMLTEDSSGKMYVYPIITTPSMARQFEIGTKVLAVFEPTYGIYALKEPPPELLEEEQQKLEGGGEGITIETETDEDPLHEHFYEVTVVLYDDHVGETQSDEDEGEEETSTPTRTRRRHRVLFSLDPYDYGTIQSAYVSTRTRQRFPERSTAYVRKDVPFDSPRFRFYTEEEAREFIEQNINVLNPRRFSTMWRR